MTKIWQLLSDDSPTNALIGKPVKLPMKPKPKPPALVKQRAFISTATDKHYKLFTNCEIIHPLLMAIKNIGETPTSAEWEAYGSMFGIDGIEHVVGTNSASPNPDETIRYMNFARTAADVNLAEEAETRRLEGAAVGEITACLWPPLKIQIRPGIPQDGLFDKWLNRQWSRNYNPIKEPEEPRQRVLSHAELLQGRRVKPRPDPCDEPEKPKNMLLAPGKQQKKQGLTWGALRKAKAQREYGTGAAAISVKRNTFSPGLRGKGVKRHKIDAASAAKANGLLPRNLPTVPSVSPSLNNITFSYFQHDPAVVDAFAIGTAEANYDSRKYPLCAPHDGSRGLSFFTFADSFLTAIATVDLRDINEPYDLSDTLIGVDDSGEVAPPGAAAPIPLPTTQAAMRRRTKRLKWAFVHLYRHITDDALRRMITNEAHNDGRAAWKIIQRECDQPVTELELEEMRQNVRSMTIAHSVGYTEYSVSRFRRALVDENCKIPRVGDRLPENDLCVLVLSAISKASAHLAPVTDTELKAAPAARQFVYPPAHPNAGLRSLTAVVEHFDPIWRAAIQRGTIPLRPPGGPRAAVAQVMAADTGAGTGFDDAGPDLRPGETLAHVAAALADSKLPRTGEIVCWNCKGLGHSKKDCPSPRVERSYAAVIAQLSSVAATRGAPTQPVRVGKGRRPPPRRGGRGTGRDAGRPGVAAYLMDDGTFCLSSGEYEEWEPSASASLSTPWDDELVDGPPPDPDDDEYASSHCVRVVDDSDDSGNDLAASAALVEISADPAARPDGASVRPRYLPAHALMVNVVDYSTCE